MKMWDVYMFIYWTKECLDADPYCIGIKARSIDEACTKFLKKYNEDAIKVDYEVEHRGKFIDITNIKGFKNLI